MEIARMAIFHHFYEQQFGSGQHPRFYFRKIWNSLISYAHDMHRAYVRLIACVKRHLMAIRSFSAMLTSGISAAAQNHVPFNIKRGLMWTCLYSEFRGFFAFSRMWRWHLPRRICRPWYTKHPGKFELRWFEAHARPQLCCIVPGQVLFWLYTQRVRLQHLYMRFCFQHPDRVGLATCRDDCRVLSLGYVGCASEKRVAFELVDSSNFSTLWISSRKPSILPQLKRSVFPCCITYVQVLCACDTM